MLTTLKLNVKRERHLTPLHKTGFRLHLYLLLRAMPTMWVLPWSYRIPFFLRNACYNVVSKDVLTRLLHIFCKDVCRCFTGTRQLARIQRQNHTLRKMTYNSLLHHITSRWYPIFLHIRITPMYLYSYKLLYKVLARKGGICNHLGFLYFKAHSFQRKLESILIERVWIPVFTGMTRKRVFQ